ncbi:MAG: MFS transporter [Gammaproteobacteria bacterium]|nr:MFS transporter [Gammaproteobacteria bacterium]
MKVPVAGSILRTYVTLVLLSTFATSFIWGINTLFLLDAGLSITEAFLVNAFFTVGQVVFEVPTGVVADTVGRRASFLAGAATLFVATLLYLLLWKTGAALWCWALASVLLGLGFTFFTGATEAWLVDALRVTGYQGALDDAFAKGEIAAGVAMLSGAVAGGVIAQWSSLGVPYLLRAVLLALTFAVAWLLMHDIGFVQRDRRRVAAELRRVFAASLRHGYGNRPVRWIILSGPFLMGVGFYAFYAMQPYLLELYSRGDAYAITGLAAAIIAGAQIVGGTAVPYVRKAFRRRTSLLFVAALITASTLALAGLLADFATVMILLCLWGIIDAASYPVRLAFINGLIPSEERATVLSTDNLVSASGGLVQPALGRVADLWGFSASYLAGGGLILLALPFIHLARKEQALSDALDDAD